MPRTARLLATCLAVALAASMAVVASPAHADTAAYRSTVPVSIGQTTETGDGPGRITINDLAAGQVGVASPYPSVAPVTGLVGKVVNVVVRIDDFAHRYPVDVDMLLVAPSGERAFVMSDQGGESQVTGVDLTFDHSASTTLSASAPLSSGTYLPSNVVNDVDGFPAPAPQEPAPGYSGFSPLFGAEPNGGWSLFVTDDAGGGVGSIAGWSITVTTTGPSDSPSTVDVTGAAGTVADVDVRLDDFSHGYPEDVDLLLVGPQGQQATVLSDVPQTADATSRDLVLDDEAASPLTHPLASGRYRPTNLGAGADTFPAPAPTATGSSALSVFDGTDPNGQWRLYAADDGPGDRGEIVGWSLDITTTGTAAPGPTPSAGAADTVSPRVSSTRPAAAAKAVRRGADITATLTEAARTGTVTRTSAYLVRQGTSKHLAATVTYRPGTRQVVIDPATRLRAHTTYKAVVTTAVKDRAGNRLDQNPTRAGLQPKSWRFTTR